MTPDDEVQFMITMINRFLLAASAASTEGLDKAEDYFWKLYLKDGASRPEARFYLHTHDLLNEVRKTRR